MLNTSVYHPQTDGLEERFNRTLKSMLRKFVQVDPGHWDKLLPALLFVVWEVPQASTGFSPFELPWGILDLLKETREEQESRALGSILYILQLQEWLQKLRAFARENLLWAQQTQVHHYN